MGNTLEKTAQKNEQKASLSMKQYGMMLALIAVYIIFAVITGGKNLSALNVNNLIMQNGYVVILAVGMLLCVLTGGAVILCSILAQIVSERIDPRMRSGEPAEVTDHG